MNAQTAGVNVRQPQLVRSIHVVLRGLAEKAKKRKRDRPGMAGTHTENEIDFVPFGLQDLVVDVAHGT